MQHGLWINSSATPFYHDNPSTNNDFEDNPNVDAPLTLILHAKSVNNDFEDNPNVEATLRSLKLKSANVVASYVD